MDIKWHYTKDGLPNPDINTIYLIATKKRPQPNIYYHVARYYKDCESEYEPVWSAAYNGALIQEEVVAYMELPTLKPKKISKEQAQQALHIVGQYCNQVGCPNCEIENFCTACWDQNYPFRRLRELEGELAFNKLVYEYCSKKNRHGIRESKEESK